MVVYKFTKPCHVPLITLACYNAVLESNWHVQVYPALSCTSDHTCNATMQYYTATGMYKFTKPCHVPLITLACYNAVLQSNWHVSPVLTQVLTMETAILQ